MFEDQLRTLTDKEDKLLEDLDTLSTEMEEVKTKLFAVRKAKKQLTKLEEQFNGEFNVPHE